MKTGPDSLPRVNLKMGGREFRLSDLMDLALWGVSDNMTNPQWAALKNKSKIRGAVVVLVDGMSGKNFKTLPPDVSALYTGADEERVSATHPVFGSCKQQSATVTPTRALLFRKLSKRQKQNAMTLEVTKSPQTPVDPHAAKWSDVKPYILSYDDMAVLRYPLHPDIRTRLVEKLSSNRQSLDHFARAPAPITDSPSNESSHKKPTASRNDVELQKVSSSATSAAPPLSSVAKPVDASIGHQQPLQETVIVAPAIRLIPVQCETDDEYIHIVAGRLGSCDKVTVLAVDCEMCTTKNGLELTRMSIVDENLNVLADHYVKPRNPILNYNTEFSGITAAHLADVTFRREDARQVLVSLLQRHKGAVLLGHSLENDLRAIKLTYDRVADTAALYSHPRGPRFRPSLRSLVANFLGKRIQDSSHDSVEDASTTMELFQLKIRHGPDFGDNSSGGVENAFVACERLGVPAYLIDRAPICHRFATVATSVVCVSNDDEATRGAIQASTRGVRLVVCGLRALSRSPLSPISTCPVCGRRDSNPLPNQKSASTATSNDSRTATNMSLTTDCSSTTAVTSDTTTPEPSNLTASPTTIKGHVDLGTSVAAQPVADKSLSPRPLETPAVANDSLSPRPLETPAVANDSLSPRPL
eukprot:Rmarinus@m.22002